MGASIGLSFGREGIVALLADLQAETDDLTELVEVLGESGWATGTPAPGWTVRDQVGHLVYFDEAALSAVTEPSEFEQHRKQALADLKTFVARSNERVTGLSGSEILAALRRARSELISAIAAAPPGTRVPWYGPDMGIASCATARLMETWAHGQDVADALSINRRATDRLRHVADLGVRTFDHSFRTRGLPVPEVGAHVELAAPDGSTWEWGDRGANERVMGTALDFCLVVTKRRHRADTTLSSTGPIAGEWLDIAQAFAGPPGEGRRPGQFARVPS